MDHTFDQGDWVTWGHRERCLVVWAFDEEGDAVIKLYGEDTLVYVYLDELTLEETGSLDNVKHFIDAIIASRDWR
jgi:hypothetical protein